MIDGAPARACRRLRTQLFSCSQQKTELPVTENVQTIPPPYVVRTILVYSRLPCQSQFSLTEPMKVKPGGRGGSGWTPKGTSQDRTGWSSPPPYSHSLQKMLQCPYFFFDIVCIHNGTEEKEDERRWKVRDIQWRTVGCLKLSDLDLPLQSFNSCFLHSTLCWWWLTWEAVALAASPHHS